MHQFVEKYSTCIVDTFLIPDRFLEEGRNETWVGGKKLPSQNSSVTIYAEQSNWMRNAPRLAWLDGGVRGRDG